MLLDNNTYIKKEEKIMGFGTGGAGCPPYFDGSFILFLILILLVFGIGFFPCKC